MKRLASLLLVLTLGMAGCSSEAEAARPPSYSTPEALTQSEEEALMEAAFWMTWRDLTYSQRSDICWGWENAPDMMDDAMELRASENGLDPSLMADLFKEACEQ